MSIDYWIKRTGWAVVVLAGLLAFIATRSVALATAVTLSLAFTIIWVRREVTAPLHRKIRELEHVARHDALTGLSNRMMFDECLPMMIADAGKADAELALIYIDLDRFKEINDLLGHGGGDTILQQVAEILRSACDEDEFIGRIGGDEFAVIQSGREQPAAAKKLVDRMLASFGQHRNDLNPFVGVSIGVAISPRDGDDDVRLRHHADLALYRAKTEGRGRACFFGAPDALPKPAHGAGQASLSAELPAAIRNGDLRVYYQPKMEARSNRIDSVEALVRWSHAVHGLIPPNDFIPIAERTGQIRQLTEWTLRTAIADQAWLAARGQDIAIYVNISAPLLGDPDFAKTLLAIVAGRSGIIGLEITETAIIDDPEVALGHLHQFVDAGLKIAIDDYGAGWSSLSYLKQLPAHELKIDREFISNISRSHRDPLLVRSTIDLAHALGMKVVAEGVETGAALALLRVMGCDLIQGFLISRAISRDGLTDFLADDQKLAHLEGFSMTLEANAS